MIIAAPTIVLFAVVANAVKALSSQTAKAADEITGSIAAPLVLNAAGRLTSQSEQIETGKFLGNIRAA
jgi:methyl-accepting chemotaxis protein